VAAIAASADAVRLGDSLEVIYFHAETQRRRENQEEGVAVENWRPE
jgi:hypothetical protein